MINYKILLAFALLHWLADFALQTHWQATNKSKDLWALAKHVGSYSIVWFLYSWTLFLNPWHCIAFAVTTFFFHFLTDLITSRYTKECFEEGDYHNGFVVIGFDQILHYIQLLVTYEFLTSLNGKI